MSGHKANRLAKVIKDAGDAADLGSRPRAFRIPVLDDDPPAGDPTNLWAFDDGRLRFRGSDGTVHEYHPVGYGGGTSDGGGTTSKPKQPDPQPTTHRRTWSATWGDMFDPSRGDEGQHPELYYGTFPGSAHGNRRLMIGLNDSSIRSALSGADIDRVEIRFTNTWAWWNSGVQVHLGGHNVSSGPGHYSSVRESVFVGHWPKSGGRTWRNAGTWYGRALRDNNIKGITIHQPSSSNAYYGAMKWASFDIRITYTK